MFQGDQTIPEPASSCLSSITDPFSSRSDVTLWASVEHVHSGAKRLSSTCRQLPHFSSLPFSLPLAGGSHHMITWGSTAKGSIQILILAPPLLFLFSLWLKLTFKLSIIWVFSKRMSVKRETRTTSVSGDELEYWLSTSLTSTEAVSAWVNPENTDSLCCNIAQYTESELIFFWLSSIREIANLAQTNPHVLLLCESCLSFCFIFLVYFLLSHVCQLCCPFQVGREDRHTHIHVRKWYNTIFFYNPEIKSRPTADSYLTMCSSHPSTQFFFFPSWLSDWCLSRVLAFTTSLGHFPFRWLQMCSFPPNSWNCFATSEISGRGRSKEKKSHARQIQGMRGAWWRHVALMGPVTWPGHVAEMASKESFGRKVERRATVAALSRLQAQKTHSWQIFAPVQLRNRVRGLKSTLLSCCRNLMLRSTNLCETHDNADKANLTALTLRSQQSLTNTCVWTTAFTLLVLLPRHPAWRNDNPVTQTSQVYIDTAMESKASSRKHANQMILIRYGMFTKMLIRLLQLMSVSTIGPIKPPGKIVLVTCVRGQFFTVTHLPWTTDLEKDPCLK